jgi:hypothetical protein
MQYLAMPVPFLIISFSYPLLYLRKLSRQTGCGNHFNIASALVAVCVFVAVIFSPAVPGRIPMLFKPQSWVPVQLHRISEDIAKETKSPKLILTLAPLYALEGRCDIYTEFSSGSFVYRVADYLFPSDRRLTHTVGPGNLRELVEKSPPSAVILGVEPKFLEVHLFRIAMPDSESWEAKIYENGPLVYFRR